MFVFIDLFKIIKLNKRKEKKKKKDLSPIIINHGRELRVVVDSTSTSALGIHVIPVIYKS